VLLPTDSWCGGPVLGPVHDGTHWMHEPLRLPVFAEASAAAIDGVLAKHRTVRHLIEQGWRHLFRIDPVDGLVYRRGTEAWLRTS